jgi:DNA-directed RNA polymerase specialized sigma24 family protein
MKNICQAVFCGSQRSFSVEEIRALKEVIAMLPMDQQLSLHLRYTQQLPVKEVAKKLNLSITTTYNKINRAIFILKNQFNPSVYENMYRILYPETGKPGLPVIVS